MTSSGVGEVDPKTAWSALTSGRKALLIDVRTRAEWTFVGLPDLSSAGAEPALLEWQSFPTMEINPDFVPRALDAIARAGAESAYFLCRSGGRSMKAALATAHAAAMAERALSCFNIAEGFEGDLNGEERRGALNGWKARGLPWRQS